MKLCIITANVGKGDGQARVNYEIVKVAIQRKHSITLVVMQVDSELKNNPLVECVYLSVNNIPTGAIKSESSAQ